MSNDSSRTSRREFLGWTSATVLAGVAARAQEPDDRIPVAVVGTGGRGCDLIRKLSTIERAQVVAVCDDYQPHLDQGLEFAGPQAEAFLDYGTMLSRIQPQAVVVAVPLHLHHRMCADALDAGAQVFCEKTMCHTIDEARDLAKRVEDKGAVFQVGLQRRANAVYQEARELVASGGLGRITAIKAQWHRNGDWRRPVPVKAGQEGWQELEHRLNWRLYWPSSQGLMSELGSHQLDVASWLTGARPRNVTASGGIEYWRDGREVFDQVFCLYEFEMRPAEGELRNDLRTAPDGEPYAFRVTYSSIQTNAYEGASELILGTRGALYLTSGKGLFYRERGVENPGWTRKAEENASIVTSGKTLKISNDPWAHRGKPIELSAEGNDTREELVAFLDCVRRHDPRTLCDVQVGLVNTASTLIANQSAREGRRIDFPSDIG